jgi:YD repeat-containing protein
MKRTITRPNRIAVLTLFVTLFLLSCNKDNEGSSNNKPYNKLVISYNKYAGDSMHYDSKGRVTEQWVDMPYPTLYEYPSVNEVVVKSITRSTGKVNNKFSVTLTNGKATQAKATHYNANGSVYKEYISGFVYDGAGRLIKVTNASGHNSDLVFTYSGEVVSTATRTFETVEFNYDMSKQLPVCVPNMIYGITWDDYYFLSGLFANGMMGKLPVYAVNKVYIPGVWQNPVEFNNSFGVGNTLLETKLKQWELMYMQYEMEMRYKTITIIP